LQQLNQNVAEFAAKELQHIIEHGVNNIPANNTNNNNNDTKLRSSTTKRPHSARNKLDEAVAFDKSHNASKIDRPGTAPAIKPDPPAKAHATGSIATDNNASSVPKTIQIAVLGVANSGKTAIINSLQGAWESGVKPTLGFRPTTMMLGSDAKIKFYDLGGGAKIRDIWEQYYHDVHAVIYVVDSAAKTDEHWAESNKVFQNVRNHALIQGKPLLLMANKQDTREAHHIDAVCELLQFETNRMNNIIGCSAFHKSQQQNGNGTHIEHSHHHTHQPDQIAVTSDHSQDPTMSVDSAAALQDIFEVDKRLELGLEWLLTMVNCEYEDINSRVIADTKKKAADEAKRRLQRERKVLKNKIASVFLEQIAPEFLPPDIDKASPDDVYDPEEGLKFLADEIGQPVESLPQDARSTAEFVGYQRLALQMIGALNCPISKKKTLMSWEEIKHMIVELREELGLTSA